MPEVETNRWFSWKHFDGKVNRSSWRKMSLNYEACENCQVLLAFLLHQVSTTQSFIKKFCCKILSEVKRVRLRPWRKESSHIFTRNTSLKKINLKKFSCISLLSNLHYKKKIHLFQNHYWAKFWSCKQTHGRKTSSL